MRNSAVVGTLTSKLTTYRVVIEYAIDVKLEIIL